LQAHLTDQRLAYRFADAGHLLVEGIKGKQVFAFSLGRKKGAEKPVVIQSSYLTGVLR